MRLILIRHGESAGNVRGVIQGCGEYPLTERGLDQARTVAAALAAASLGRISALYTSPLARAMATAAIVGRALGAAPSVEPDLRECDVGDAIGFTWDEFAERFPENAARLETNSDGRIVDHLWPGGETASEFRARCRRAVERIVSRHGADDTVVVVSHSGAISWMLARLLDPGLDCWPTYSLPNASISEVSLVDGRPTAVRIGETSA